MPELPDLTVYQRNLRKMLVHRHVDHVNVFRAKRLNVPPDALNAAVRDSTLLDIGAKVRNCSFDFRQDTASRSISCSRGSSTLLKILGDRSQVGLACVRAPELSRCIGPQGLGHVHPRRSSEQRARCSVGRVHPRLSSRKAHGMPSHYDEGVLDRSGDRAGIGNAYADEILWESRISPQSTSTGLPDPVIVRLYDLIKIVLRSAIDSISEAAPDAINGEHRDFLKVHNPN